jgi:hypothetical protein
VPGGLKVEEPEPPKGPPVVGGGVGT